MIFFVLFAVINLANAKFISIRNIKINTVEDKFNQKEITKLITRTVWQSNRYTLLITDENNTSQIRDMVYLDSNVDCFKSQGECIIEIILNGVQIEGSKIIVKGKVETKNMLNKYKELLYRLFYGNNSHKEMKGFGKKSKSKM